MAPCQPAASPLRRAPPPALALLPAAAFIDADEFIVLQPEVPTLPALLQQFEQYGGLVMHWLVFSSGGQEQRPEGGVLRRCGGAGRGGCVRRWCRTEQLHAALQHSGPLVLALRRSNRLRTSSARPASPAALQLH